MAATNSSGIKGTLLTQLNTQVLPLSGALVPFEFGGWPLLECGGRPNKAGNANGRCLLISRLNRCERDLNSGVL
jgi:hypothetical protein